jgi:hypothetical protein
VEYLATLLRWRDLTCRCRGNSVRNAEIMGLENVEFVVGLWCFYCKVDGLHLCSRKLHVHERLLGNTTSRITARMPCDMFS